MRAAAVVALAVMTGGCLNPFAPRLAEEVAEHEAIADQRTVTGLFQKFRYAYVLRDTLLYGQLLDSAFTFSYRNYELGVDVVWGRQEDMRATAGLFRAAQHIELVWHEIVDFYGDSVQCVVSRGFALEIAFSPTDVVRIGGRATFRLQRSQPDQPWRIVSWRDESME
ncbi:MAG: hypothetical protein NZ960_02395 [Candidatus Kapabacteria bacterium]|nr:hypothetical protein [Candidatus Kapabacteria bacterium]MDW8011873.1 hypothetical protein [Bacteroidota bacterium]